VSSGVPRPDDAVDLKKTEITKNRQIVGHVSYEQPTGTHQ